MSLCLSPYPEYKDSGIKWLGPIPAHWDVKRCKLLLQEIEARSTDGKEQLLSVSQYTGVTPRRTKTGSDEADTRAESLIGYKRVAPNDLVVNIMLAWNGSMGVSKYDGLISPAYCIYRFKPNAVPWYYHHLLRQPVYKGRIKTASTGVVESRLRLYSDALFRLEALVPPTEEQEQIARFVADYTRRSERLIHTKRRLIELLNEQKQAIIHRAVTRGLDPDVPLKPSGVEWLGEVPEHWEVKKLRYLATKFGSGVTPRGGSQIYVEDGIPFLRSQNIHFDGLRLDVVARIPKTIHYELSGTHVKPGDVLLNITGASIGRVCFVPDSFEDGNVSQHVCIIRPQRRLVKSAFIAALLSSPGAQYQLYISQNGSSREGLTLRAIKGFSMPVPSVEEQDLILTAITVQTRDIVKAIDKAQAEIGFIREYRTRLVSDVVTGQLDVRGLALPDVDAEAAGMDAEAEELDEGADEELEGAEL